MQIYESTGTTQAEVDMKVSVTRPCGHEDWMEDQSQCVACLSEALTVARSMYRDECLAQGKTPELWV